jgi:hypothetical protein
MKRQVSGTSTLGGPQSRNSKKCWATHFPSKLGYGLCRAVPDLAQIMLPNKTYLMRYYSNSKYGMNRLILGA